MPKQGAEAVPGGHTKPWWLDVLTLKEEHDDSFQRESWAGAGFNIDDSDRLWRQYLILVDLYKYYLDIAWKVSVWYYAITGAILSYYFANRGSLPTVPLDLLLIFLSVASLGFVHHHYRGSKNLHDMTVWLDYIAHSLMLPGRPHVEFAAAFLLVNCALVGLVAVACAGYLILA
jgi:hypothetical protein